ncbi:MAG TPA: hypothetical protein VGN26_14645 [Armatimonadota bacterium]|jgi:hypothetical protein
MTTFAVVPLGWENVGIWVAAICTLGIYSLLLGENKVSRFFEHIFLAAGGAYGIVITVKEVLRPMWWDPMVGGYGTMSSGGFVAGLGPLLLGLLALVLGSFWYFTYSRKYNWLSRLVVGLIIGADAGMVFRVQFGLYLPQIAKSFKPLIDKTPLATFNNIIFTITLLSVMLYFFFAFERKSKVVTGGANLGRWLLMLCFGAMFGNTVMARMALFIDRFSFLLFQWLGLPQPK